jgi:penicillin amidase
VQERPPHLLDPRYDTWEALLLGAVDTLLDEALGDDHDGLDHYTWGAVNKSRITHPLSPFLPGASRWLDMPAMALPGDRFMPRVQTPTAGASQRMVVSPGRETEGIFHMPGGQSGHPLSPHYRDGHAAWARGAPTPFLPGPAKHTLVLLSES